MNMLVIGNGFDLAHERPTRYSDFLQFLEYILSAKDYPDDRLQFEDSLNIECHTVKQYILDSFDTRKNPGTESAWNKNPMIQEIYERLDKNVWYEYFKKLWENDLINGKNWIDFEQEILEVIDFFDHEITNKYAPISKLKGDSLNEKITYFWSLFYMKIQQEHVQRCIWSDFIDKTYQDLQDFVRCLEIYLDDCVREMPIPRYSPDIKDRDFYSILSFNYTKIPTEIYPLLTKTNVHYIHGYAKASCPAGENNMVLGVNEYWDDTKKDSHTNFNLYKKFVQRIIKETGIDYKLILEKMNATYEDEKKFNRFEYGNVFIFGHSLDITDKDILKEIMLTEGVITTIFYKDKQQQANQIANLSKVLGQDELLKRTVSTFPTIIFKKQADMVEL